MALPEAKVVRLSGARPGYGRVPLAALNADPRLRGETWRVLVALCGFANRSGRCWPSRRRLAKDSKTKQRNLGRNLRPLTEAGLIRINGKDDYTVLFEHTGEPEQHTGEPEQHTGEPEQHTGEPEQHTGVLRAIQKNRPTNKTNEADHSTARMRASESAIEIHSPMEVERADQFELLWVEYPSRPDDSKRLARQAFDELVSAGVHADHLIAAAVRYAEWVKCDEPGGVYAPHLHRWLRDGRYQHDGKSWPRPRRSIVGIARDLLENSPPLATDRQHQASPREPRVFWTDRLEELERTATWSADWGPPPDDPACQLPPKFRGKPCVRRWLEHRANRCGR